MLQDWFPVRADVLLADGLDLAEAHSLALFFSPELREARAEEKVRDALLLQAGRLDNPTLFAGPRLAAPESVWIVPLSLSQPITLGGRLQAEEDHAAADRDEARARVVEVELQVLAAIRREYLRGAALTRELAILEISVADAERAVGWVERRLAAGSSDALEAFAARAALDGAREARTHRRRDLAAASRGIRRAVGLLPDAPVDPVFDLAACAVPAVPPPNEEARLLHPRLVAREAEHRAARAALGEALAGRWPELAIGPEFESVGSDLSLGLGASVELPLFDRNEGNVLAARERVRQATERYRRELLDLAREEQEARAAMDAAEQRVAEMEALVASADAARAALAARFDRGEVDLLRAVLASDALVRTELRRVAAERDRALARIDAFLASGLAMRPSRHDAALEPSRDAESPVLSEGESR